MWIEGFKLGLSELTIGLASALVGLLVGRYWTILDAKRLADIEKYRRLEIALTHDMFRSLIDDTWNMMYNAEYLNTPINSYLALVEDPTSAFHNRNLQKKRVAFDKSLGQLFRYVSLEFGFPDHNTVRIMNLQTIAPHETERYRRVSNEVRRLNNEAEKNHRQYRELAKKKLYI